jgi:Ca-activated chloride channel family protein
MRFAQLEMLAGLWAVAGLTLFLYWAGGNRKKMAGRFARDHLLKDVASQVDVRKYVFKNILLTAVVLLSVVALARPQWGFEWREVKRQGIDIMIVVDTSKSMLTQDVKPNRLERTKFAVQDLLKKLKGDRVGLIAFAGEPFLLCPLTVDYGGFQISLNDLNVDAVPRGGTNLAKAVEEAVKDYDKVPGRYKAVIVVTDGDNLEGEPLAAARKAKEKGVKIYTAGIGSPDGELIQIHDARGGTTFLKDREGNFVKSRLNEGLLKRMALVTGGIYVRSSGGEFGLDLIYERELSKLEKREIEAKQERRYFERFQFPLGLAFLLLVVETCMTARKK